MRHANRLGACAIHGRAPLDRSAGGRRRARGEGLARSSRLGSSPWDGRAGARSPLLGRRRRRPAGAHTAGISSSASTTTTLGALPAICQKLRRPPGARQGRGRCSICAAEAVAWPPRPATQLPAPRVPASTPLNLTMRKRCDHPLGQRRIATGRPLPPADQVLGMADRSVLSVGRRRRRLQAHLCGRGGSMAVRAGPGSSCSVALRVLRSGMPGEQQRWLP